MTYSRELYDKRTAEDCATLYTKRMTLEQVISKYGYQSKHKLQKEIKLNRCMADNDNNVIISPAGFLGKCEHYIDREFFGHIDSKERNTDTLCRFKDRPEETEACAACPFYPQCFRLVMCDSEVDCTPERQKEYFHNIIEAMKDEYVKYLKKEENDNENEEDETEL